jgi:hypothetical protein
MLSDLDDIRRTIERALPPYVVDAMHEEGIALTLVPQLEPGEALVDISDELAERELAGDMVNYKKKTTGVDNTVFISQKGYTRHGPRIKIAIEPPDSISVTSKTVSVAIDTGKVVAGNKEKVSAALQKQVLKFVVLNRDVLLDYWNAKISTEELQEKLKAVPEE